MISHNNFIPEKITLKKKVIINYQYKIKSILSKIYKSCKRKERSEKEFYSKYSIPDSKFNYFVQNEVLKSISIKQLLIESNLHDYISKNISKNYLIYSMIFFRYHHSILDINTKKIYLDNFHYDNYHNLKTNTFWIPLCDINQSTGGLVFYSDNKNNTKKSKNFLQIKKLKINSLFQVLTNIGSCFKFDKNLLHGANKPKKNYIRLSLDIRVIDKKDFKKKKLFRENYFNSKDILRPNKFVKLNDIDKEIKKYTKNNFKNLI